MKKFLSFLFVMIPLSVGAQALTGSKVQDTYKDLTHFNNSNLGASTTTTTQLYDGAGNALSLHLTDDVLDEATGDEYAAKLLYTTNKATSGNDTALVISLRDTASPGTSYFLDLGTNTDGTTGTHTNEWWVKSDGTMSARDVTVETSLQEDGLDWGLVQNTGLELSNVSDVLWSSTALYSGGKVANLSMWDDSLGTTGQYWIAADDGGGDANADGYIAAEEVMVGGQTGPRLTHPGSLEIIQMQKNDGTNGGRLYAEYLYGSTSIWTPIVTPITGLNETLALSTAAFSSADIAVDIATGTASNSSGEFVAVEIGPTVSQTATASATILKLDATTTAVGSGGMKFISALDDSSEVFSVDSAGAVTIGAADLLLSRHEPSAGVNYLEADNDAGTIADGVGTAYFLAGTGSSGVPALGMTDSGNQIEGFYSAASGSIGVSLNGVLTWVFNTSKMGKAVGNGPAMTFEDSSRTNPIFAENTDLDTGLSGGAGGDDGEISLISDGTEIMRVDGNAITQTVAVSHATCTAADGDTTPSVASCAVITTSANTGGTAITDLDDPVVGSVVRIIGGSDTNSSTIADSGNFNLSAAWTASLDDVLTLYVQADNDYIELSRSDN